MDAGTKMVFSHSSDCGDPMWKQLIPDKASRRRESTIVDLRAELNRALEHGRMIEALELYDLVEKRNPDEPRWSHRKGDLLRRIGRETDALRAYERAAYLYSVRGFDARAAATAKLMAWSGRYGVGMDRAMGQPAEECVEIDHPWISNDLMPLYRWTFPSEATDEELNACLRARDDWAIRARYHFAWVIDLSNITNAPATQRRALADHLKGYEEFSKRWNAGSALVVPSAWLRGLVTAVFWISPPKYPHKTFSEPLEAERWARRQLTARLAELD